MRAATLALATLVTGCSLSGDFDQPFPGPADVGQGDLLPLDAAQDLGPDARTAPPDSAVVDLATPLDQGGPPPDGAAPDAGPSDAGPDAQPECRDGEVRAERCGDDPPAWRRERCVDGAWRAGRCAAQAPYACGAQTFDYVDGEPVQRARYVYWPNLAGRTRFHSLEAAARSLCDGCFGDEPRRADGVFDLEIDATHAPDGLAEGWVRRAGQPLQVTVRGQIDYRLQDGVVDERVLNGQTGAELRLDRHQIDGSPRYITWTYFGVTADAPKGQRRYHFGYGPFDELRSVRVEEGPPMEPIAISEFRRYHYDDDGGWVRLDLRAGGPEGPLRQQFYFDATCLACDASGCTYDVPEGCTHVPLRLGPQGFQGGWPSALCAGGSHDFARRRCRGDGQGELARFDTRFDQEWVWQVAGDGGLIRVGGYVDAQGVARWDSDDALVPTGLLSDGAFLPGACLGLGPGGRLYGMSCASDPDRPETRFLCERRPG